MTFQSGNRVVARNQGREVEKLLLGTRFQRITILGTVNEQYYALTQSEFPKCGIRAEDSYSRSAILSRRQMISIITPIKL